MNRRESVGRLSARTHSASAPVSQKMVSVAVLPPRLVPGMAPPTGIGAADCFSWEESINWVHNEPIEEEGPPPTKGKQLMRKAGLTTRRYKRNPDLPPFVMRQIPFETWRMHYAKDKDGNYHGTHAPAEDCLLKPNDVQKWRLGAPKTKADLWTRGREALPVYAEVQHEGLVPEYEVDYTGPPRDEPVVVTEEDDMLASHFEREERRLTSSVGPQATRIPSQAESYSPPRTASLQSQGSSIESGVQPQARAASIQAPAHAQASNGHTGEIIANGKTAQQIIEEAKASQAEKAKSASYKKKSWKDSIKRGAEYAMMGAS